MAINKLQRSGIILGVIVVAVILIFGFIKPIIYVPPGHAAVVVNIFQGMEQRTLKTGLHFMVPMIQRPEIYDVRKESYTISSVGGEGDVAGDDSIEALTSDGQNVWIDLTVIYRFDPDRLYRFHEEIKGRGFKNDLLRPAIRSSIRNTVSRYSAIELYSSDPATIAQTLGISVEELDTSKIGRTAIEQDINDKLTPQMAKNYVIVDNLNLRNIKFTEQYKTSIEEKAIERENAKKLDFVIEREKKQKEVAEIQATAKSRALELEAEGQAKAIDLVGEALRRNPSVISYEYVQKLSPNVQAIITDNEAIVNVSELLKK
ncbi:MAG: hypothetical protein MJB14_06685 [Spirochaetes bacterium]|nr:hypothetical protein [Spirochaetota bacterium]